MKPKHSFYFVSMDLGAKTPKRSRPIMKDFQIWVGNHGWSQGEDPPMKPRLIGTVRSVDFKTACYKHELQTSLARIKDGERKGDLNDQDYPWWFDENKISNSWLGKYYETEQEAWESFK